MRRWSDCRTFWTLAWLLAACLPAARAAETVPADDWRVSVLTFGPGANCVERFGHVAIRVRSVDRQVDIAYDWGNFDFDEPNFVGKFVRGSLYYWMEGKETGRLLAYYKDQADRTTIEQTLNLTPRQTYRLVDAIVRQQTGRDRYYLYDYFLDNCSTRVRDVIDHAVDGALARQLKSEPTPHSFRWHERRLMPVGGVNQALCVLIDLAFGSRTDRPISQWEAAFLPTLLADQLDRIEIEDAAGRRVPLVRERRVLNRTTSPGNAEPLYASNPLRWTLPVGLLSAAILLLFARGLRIGFLIGASLWQLFVLFGAVFLPVMVLFTRHWVVAWNENFLQFTPCAALILPVLWRRSRRSGVLRHAATVAVGLSLLGMIVTISHLTIQPSAPSVALALPLHVATWVGLRWIGTPAADAGTSKGIES